MALVVICALPGKSGTPIRGYSGSDAAVLTQSGLRVKVAWAGRDTMNFPDPQFRVHIWFTGPAGLQVRLYAAYIE